jgi:hypothetical protein
MDQVLLPFVIDQNTTHAVDGEEHIHIRSPGADGLDKRQYTMHIFSNAGRGDKADGYIDMIARGKGTRISRAEKQAWHEEVNVRWQKCAWVDRPVMLEIAKCIVCCSRQGEHLRRANSNRYHEWCFFAIFISFFWF